MTLENSMQTPGLSGGETQAAGGQEGERRMKAERLAPTAEVTRRHQQRGMLKGKTPPLRTEIRGQ